MKRLSLSHARQEQALRDERGISVLELLIVILMVSVVTAFALLRIADARQALRLSNSAQEFTSYLEKARIDSIRRHAETPAQMASVQIDSTTSYVVTYDFDGDGTLETRPIVLPPQQGVSFNAAIPTTIRFDWRGRTVNAAGALTVPAAFDLQDPRGQSTRINVTGSGDATVGSYASVSNVNINTAYTDTMRAKTGIPIPTPTPTP